MILGVVPDDNSHSAPNAVKALLDSLTSSSLRIL